MKNLYNTVSEGIFNTTMQDMDLDAALIVVNEWAKKTQTNLRYTKKNIRVVRGELVLIHNQPSLRLSIPCPIKLMISDEVAQDKMIIRIQSTTDAVKQGITLFDTIEYYKEVCAYSNIWHVEWLIVEIPSRAKLSKPLYLPSLSTDIEYHHISINCQGIIDIDMGMVVRADVLEINKPAYIQMLGVPQNVKEIQITR